MVGPAPGGAYASSVAIVGKTLDFPDPFVLQTTNGFYAYSTGSGFSTAQVISSPDAITWSWVGDPFSGGGSRWADLFGNTWAPSVLERQSNPSSARFVMYYTSRDHASGAQCVGRAVSASPSGPFTDSASRPLICQSNLGGSIDASPYVATDGSLHLVWSSGNPNITARIWTTLLSDDGLSTRGAMTNILSVAPATWEAPIVEGPAMMTAPDGHTFLFYSANVWTTSGYADGVARCDTPNGPCTRVYTNAVLGSRDTMLGPGGGTPFRDANGQWQLAFHAWESPKVGYTSDAATTGARTLRILPITFPSGLPAVG